MTSGRDLRAQVEHISEFCTEVRSFLEEKDALSPNAEQTITELEDTADDLFYLIPLEE